MDINEWRNVNAVLPALELNSCSLDVLTFGKDGYAVGFYQYDRNKWWLSNDMGDCELFGVTNWMLLPEKPNER